MPPSAIVLSLVIPAWNEAAAIGRAVIEATEAFGELGWDHEIIVVDDGSTDGTAFQVEEIAALRSNIRVIRHSRNLGYGAVKFLMSRESDGYGAIMSYEGGSLKPLKFEDMIDPATSRMRPRLVDVKSELFECAVRYMTRLEADDFDTPEELAKLAAVVKLTPAQFKDRFEYLVKPAG